MIKVDETFNIDYTDPSGMCECNRCPAKFMFDRLMGLSLPDKMTIALDYGTDMHLALPHCYEEDIKCIERAIGVFSESWDKRGYGDEDKGRNTFRARASLAEFQRIHKPSACVYDIIEFPKTICADTADIVSQNELPFLIDIGGPLPLAGRIDAVVRMKTTNGLWALDYKTASEVSARYFANFENCPQAVAYTLGLSTVLGEKVEGLIVEAIRTSPKNTEVQMCHVFVNPHQTELFVEHAANVADQMLTYNTNREWPQRTAACAPYSMFGQPGRFCEYKDLCVIGDWKEMERYYKRGAPFHPFKVVKK